MNYPKSGLGAFLEISQLIKTSYRLHESVNSLSEYSCTLTGKYDVVNQNKHFPSLVIMYAVMYN